MKKLFTLFAVAVLAFAAQAGTVTVAEGTATNSHYPFYGLYYDTQGTLSQVIYPADMLTDLVGKQITEIKFYTRESIALNAGGQLEYSLKVVEQNEFETSTPVELGADDVVGHGAPVYGENTFVITLDEPFQYDGGNLLLQCVVTETSNYQSLYFYGIETGLYGALYQYQGWSGSWYSYTDAFLPEAVFTYDEGTTPPEPTEMCLAPNSGYEITGIEQATVTITNREEGATVVYEVYCDGELVDTGLFTGDEYSFVVTGAGSYVIHAIATLPTKLDSPDGGVFFTIMENEGPTGVNELVNGKNVASVRYFNVAGQEMQEANGLTIVVTTYTDGTTSTAKVVK